MIKFSANLGFLWTELTLPDAIHAAKAAGFDAVECHWPYATPAAEIQKALSDTRLTMLGLNTVRGNPGENGLSALPGRGTEARAAIDQAIEYAQATGTPKIHVMAGFASGPEADAIFAENLRYACTAAPELTMLIEPLNHHDAPGYFLNTSAQAKAIIETLALPNLKLMFDCYHLQIMEGDLTRRLTALLPVIGHIQIAGVPSRAEPDRGEVDFAHILNHIDSLGYAAPIGAEYKPAAGTDAGLGWIKALQTRRDAMTSP